jgi:hypothetical protein
MTFSINFSGDRHSPRRANVTWLRHAYLILFAIAGYRYIFQPGLGIVRKQIREPEAQHIPVFLAAHTGEHPWSERHIIKVREPEWLQSWAVSIGRYITFLPEGGDVEFYARLVEKGHTTSQHFTGDEIEWPLEPTFGLAVPRKPSESDFPKL